MNLYFRLIWIWIRSWFKPKIEFKDKIILNLRVLPGDLDINRHLNNGRYLTILDLATIDLFLRSGALKSAIRHGYMPMLGGSIVTYRKGLSLFERYTVTMQLEAWDSQWNFCRFEFRKQDGRLAATGYFKGALVSKNGLVQNKIADDIVGFKRGTCELPPAVEHWIKAERLLATENLVEQAQ